MPTHPRAHQHGYTLVELAIVVTIVGLIIGAVVAGKSMLRQTELQSIALDYARHSEAVAKFRQQYGSWPGDMLDATTYWPSGDPAGSSNNITDAVCRNGIAAPANLSKTCNGNNNGLIDNTHEPYLAWQHLMLAKLVKGNFLGIDSSGAKPQVNVPNSRLKGAGWSIYYKPATSGNGTYYDLVLGNALVYGATVSGDITKGAILTPEEAGQLDTKTDDGAPGLGRVAALKGSDCVDNKSTATDDTDDIYKKTSKSVGCALIMSLTLK